MRKKKKNGRIKKGHIFLFGIFILTGFIQIKSIYNAPISYKETTTIIIKKGDTISKFYDHLGKYKKIGMKARIRNNPGMIPNLQEGTYTLQGSYSKKELMKQIAKGAEKNFSKITILEGRSIYDIDKNMTEKGLIAPGTFITTAKNQDRINTLKKEFGFLNILPQDKSLEGFLYPDTYFIDKKGDVSQQLIKAQLKNFEKKIRTPEGKNLTHFRENNLSPYDILNLSSIIENEEKKAENKPIIADIFLTRLKKKMTLGADITLCYGLEITYDKCLKNIHHTNLRDKTNPYNTRENSGLPPTPICSPTLESVQAVLKHIKTDYLYYLHDNTGGIHYGKTYEEHLTNKAKYL